MWRNDANSRLILHHSTLSRCPVAASPSPRSAGMDTTLTATTARRVPGLGRPHAPPHGRGTVTGCSRSGPGRPLILQKP